MYNEAICSTPNSVADLHFGLKHIFDANSSIRNWLSIDDFDASGIFLKVEQTSDAIIWYDFEHEFKLSAERYNDKIKDIKYVFRKSQYYREVAKVALWFRELQESFFSLFGGTLHECDCIDNDALYYLKQSLIDDSVLEFNDSDIKINGRDSILQFFTREFIENKFLNNPKHRYSYINGCELKDLSDDELDVLIQHDDRYCFMDRYVHVYKGTNYYNNPEEEGILYEKDDFGIKYICRLDIFICPVLEYGQVKAIEKILFVGYKKFCDNPATRKFLYDEE